MNSDNIQQEFDEYIKDINWSLTDTFNRKRILNDFMHEHSLKQLDYLTNPRIAKQVRAFMSHNHYSYETLVGILDINMGSAQSKKFFYNYVMFELYIQSLIDGELIKVIMSQDIPHPYFVIKNDNPQVLVLNPNKPMVEAYLYVRDYLTKYRLEKHGDVRRIKKQAIY